MAQTGYTPIQLYRTTTLGAAPTSGNLAAGELAININDADMALYAKNNTGTVTRLINNPASLKYPTADGSANQIIKTDGSGNLSFTNAAIGDVTAAGNNAFTGANTFYNSTGQIFGTGTSTQDGIKITGRAGGSSSYLVTLTPATLASSTTLTLPNVTDTVATIGTAQTFTAAQTFRAASAIRSEAASTQDAIVVAGRAGGTSSYAVTLTPTTLSANRTLTAPDASTTIVGTDATQTLTNKTLTNPTVTNYVETPYSANSSTAITIDLTNGTVQIITLTGNATITMPTAVSGKSFLMMLKQDGTGSRTVTWSTVKWAGGTAPTITSTASRMDIFSFFSDGTNWYGATIGQNYTP